MDNTCERNMQGTDDCLQDGHYIKLFAEQLTRIFEVFVLSYFIVHLSKSENIKIILLKAKS